MSGSAPVVRLGKEEHVFRSRALQACTLLLLLAGMRELCHMHMLLVSLERALQTFMRPEAFNWMQRVRACASGRCSVATFVIATIPRPDLWASVRRRPTCYDRGKEDARDDG